MSFEKMAFYSGGRFDVTGAGKPEAVGVSRVSPDFFSVLGIEPIHGGCFSRAPYDGERVSE